jgi:hypothetical protein
MIELVNTHLHEEEYTLDELCVVLETTPEEIALNSLNQNTANCKKKHFKSLYIKKIVLI